jgi:ribosome-binding ATPase YchF (GTP1/OBG family)
MNLRAVAFSLATVEGFEDVNRPDLVAKRSPIVVDAVIKYQRASKLYDIAKYVHDHGRLPNEDAEHDEATEMDAVPDELVKSTLDNLRKNYNKMKKREQTPERVALLQKHVTNIKKLEARWHLLKFQQ